MGVGKPADKQLNAARAWDLGVSASTMSVANLQPTASGLSYQCLSSLLFLVLEAQSIGLDRIYIMHSFVSA